MNDPAKIIGGKHFFITGASGFLGSNVVKALLRYDCKVSVLIRTNSDLGRIEPYRKALQFLDLSGNHPLG